MGIRTRPKRHIREFEYTLTMPKEMWNFVRKQKGGDEHYEEGYPRGYTTIGSYLRGLIREDMLRQERMVKHERKG